MKPIAGWRAGAGRWRRRLVPSAGDARSELLAALEILALTSLAFGRPVLDSFGRSPETFVARGASARDIVLFGLAVSFVPALAVIVVGAASRALGTRARSTVHLAVIAALGGVAAWRVAGDAADAPGSAAWVIALGLVGAVVVGVARRRAGWPATFLRYAGVVSVVFLGQFLATSPTSALIFGRQPAVDDEVAAGVEAQIGDTPPDVLYIVFDALPTAGLLDGSGHIDAELFPNFARLADGATWYRNNTSVAAFTVRAVPALLTGRYPEPPGPLVPPPDPENLFTLLAGSYEVEAREYVTRLCPVEVCPTQIAGGFGGLLRESLDLWVDGVGRRDEARRSSVPEPAGPNRYQQAEAWAERMDPAPGGHPSLYFHHIVLPHAPWMFTDDGTTYATPDREATGWAEHHWLGPGLSVAGQRDVLQTQAADRLLGRHLDRLRDAGTFDDTLVVVTADHGAALIPDEPDRFTSEQNYPYTMWAPLLVKLPGQTEGAVDNSDVRSVDVVPTIADELGVEIPWDVDGIPVTDAARRRDGVEKPLVNAPWNPLYVEDGEPLITVDAQAGLDAVLASDPVEATGPDAVWKRTEHGDLLGRRVEDLDVGSGAGGSVVVDTPGGSLTALDRGEPLPLEVVGSSQLDPGVVVAYALNGTIGAVTAVEPGFEPDTRLVHGLLHPDVFVDGDNELTAYVIEGEVGRETLHPLRVATG